MLASFPYAFGHFNRTNRTVGNPVSLVASSYAGIATRMYVLYGVVTEISILKKITSLIWRIQGRLWP
jgi:hypothetical protein